jgi:uncharacterized protein (TIGR02001 family)
MKKLSSLLILSGLISGPVLAADAPASPHTVAFNVGVVSQYVYRGITQTTRDVALQGGIDYSHSSGFYAGTWGSTIKWFDDYGVKNSAYTSDTNVEVDLYGGYKGSAGDIAYDVGLLQYWYPGSYGVLPAGTVKPNTTEIYGAATYGIVTGKLSYTISGGLFGVDNADGSYYADLTANYPIAEGWTLTAHVGHQKYAGNYVPGSSNKIYSYTDWKLGIAKDLGSGWSATAYYTDTNAKDAGYKAAQNDGKNMGAGQLVVGVTKTF